MAFPSKAEVDTALAGLSQAVEGYSDAQDLNGHMARVEVIARAKQLIRSVVSAEMTPNYHGLNMAELIAIRTFIKLKVLEAIPREGQVSLEDLAKATGVQDSLLERMGRVLVAAGFLEQSRPDGGDYMHTKFSRAYLLDKPGPGHLFLAMYDEWFKKMHAFDDYLEKKGLEKASEPDDPLHNPYTAYHNQEGTPVWAIMSQDPERFQTFQQGMSGIDLAVPTTGHFDFGKLKNSREDKEKGVVELVDVGGGSGAVLQSILKAHPDLDPGSCVLQDRAEVIELSHKVGVLPAEVKRQEHDFMTEQPIKGAKAYFMRMIMHDYSDHVDVEILSRLAEAMSPDSRVLICDMVLPARVSEADFPSAVMDQAVMTMGGKERTEAGFAKLLDAAGLQLVQTWRAPGVPGACVEAKLKA
ncbi:hypothetical protein NLU13_5277 [Sarocladium strictum]|uniref:O-methyltransferase domain-containing protein n=1 Tax=Sarocladium strictum TaxID=5046 RepID=A0AA39GI66_SARSR|nr:hypothetical protein NLU13_5277 [Sarocladium strictum]